MAKTKGKTDNKDLTPNEKSNLQADMKRFGYLLPTNDEELEEFNKIFGKTQVMFPEHLKRPAFLQGKAIGDGDNSRKTGKAISLKSFAQAKPANTGKNDYFKKLVLAAEVANQLHKEPTFGHVKFVKVYLLCDKMCEMNLNSSYERHAAGPLDPTQMRVFDAEFKKKKWFTVTRTDYGAYKYSPDLKIDEYKVWYGRYFKNQLNDISRIIELFRKKPSDFCEIVATIFFLWMDFNSNHKPVNNASLIKDFYEWDEKKKRFSESQILQAIDWMNEHRVIPTLNK